MSDIENKIAVHVLTTESKPDFKSNWANWFSIRDSLLPQLKTFIDDRLRTHSRGVVEFEADDRKIYILLRPKTKLNHFTYLVVYKGKDGAYNMVAIKDGKVVSKGMMMFAFSEALQQK